MIEIVGLVGLLAFLVSSGTIGVRLLARGLRTRQVPELAIGVAFVVGGVLGYAPETVILSTDLLPTSTGHDVLLLTQIAIRVAAVGALLFTWWVFRADAIWAHALALALLAALVISWVAFPQTQSVAQDARDRLWYDVFTISRSVCVGWGSVESFLYYAKLRRRALIGLSDPLLTNRFLLWGVGLLSMTLLMASTLLASWFGVDPAAFGWVILESLTGVTGAATLWLTFFPTRGYRARILARAQLG
jgi:hypothetical protein